MNRALYYYTFSLTLFGVFMHVLGTLGLYRSEMPKGLHMLLYAAGIMVLIGLNNKSLWGYVLALVIYLEQFAMQGYWGLQSFSRGHFIQPMVVCPMVMLALWALVFNRRVFLSRQQALSN